MSRSPKNRISVSVRQRKISAANTHRPSCIAHLKKQGSKVNAKMVRRAPIAIHPKIRERKRHHRPFITVHRTNHGNSPVAKSALERSSQALPILLDGLLFFADRVRPSAFTAFFELSTAMGELAITCKFNAVQAVPIDPSHGFPRKYLLSLSNRGILERRRLRDYQKQHKWPIAPDPLVDVYLACKP